MGMETRRRIIQKRETDEYSQERVTVFVTLTLNETTSKKSKEYKP